MTAQRVLKGAIVAYELPDTTPQVLPFQYNPHLVSRTLEPRSAGGEDGNQTEALRLAGAPIQTIKLEVELDATDALEKSNADVIESGLHPQLAALELLIHPRTLDVIERSRLLDVGTIEVTPPQGPFTLLILGPKRILPVRITGFEVGEDGHDPTLNPLRAKVSLTLRVLGYDDLPRDHPGYHLFLAHQSAQEGMARDVRVSDLNAVLGQDRRLF